jgi:4-amino-4-deoxy-L-arabinose transferase-like glycosyltransferase
MRRVRSQGEGEQPAARPIRGWSLALICLIYIGAGLTDHDPWKAIDAVNFGVVFSMLEDHRAWIVPHLAGSPWLESPPLYHWSAALVARATEWLLPLPDAVRLTSGLFAAMFFIAMAGAGRALHGSEGTAATTLVAVGTLGLLVPLHETQAASALLAACATAYWGLAILPDSPRRGGLMLGGGIGAAFLAAGLDGLLALLPLVLLCLGAARWRSSEAVKGLAFATSAALPLVALWPALLAWRSPRSLEAWWNHELLRLHPAAASPFADYAELLSWFTWPALPLAAWAVWRYRRQINEAAVALPLAGTVVGAGIFLFLRNARPGDALPLLVPLVLLAAAGAGQLRRGAANAFDWFGMMTFSLAALIVWLIGTAIDTGVPAQMHDHFARLEPGYAESLSPLAWIASALLTCIWFWHIWRAPRSPWRAITHWAAGVTLTWSLIAALAYPWINYGKSYRGVALDLKQDVPTADCVAGRNLGEALRASLHYFAGVVTRPAELSDAGKCPLLLEQTPGEQAVPAPAGWHVIWEGQRPGDRSERLHLYRRDGPA